MGLYSPERGTRTLFFMARCGVSYELEGCGVMGYEIKFDSNYAIIIDTQRQ